MCGSNGLHHISREWHGMGNPFFYPHGALFPVFPGDSFAFSVGPGSVLWCVLVPGDARPGPGRACASGPCGWQTISAVLARSGPGVRRAQPCGSGDAPRVARRGSPFGYVPDSWRAKEAGGTVMTRPDYDIIRILLALLVVREAGGSTD